MLTRLFRGMSRFIQTKGFFAIFSGVFEQPCGRVHTCIYTTLKASAQMLAWMFVRVDLQLGWILRMQDSARRAAIDPYRQQEGKEHSE